MIVVRDIFRMKFGKAREVTALFKQGVLISQRSGFGKRGVRLLTDLAGEPYYTLILETTHESLAKWEESSAAVRANAEWRTWYEQVTPLIENGERKIYAVVE